MTASTVRTHICSGAFGFAPEGSSGWWQLAVPGDGGVSWLTSAGETPPWIHDEAEFYDTIARPAVSPRGIGWPWWRDRSTLLVVSTRMQPE
ncbi:hypothetical protein BH23GEM8_BH23GEM8_05670 [soil metagenome]